MHIREQLKNIGLHESEIKVYLFLLTEGISTPPSVARGTKIARTHCYGILQDLKLKGLVEEELRGGRKAYLASDPEALIRSLERKKEQMERLLPDLRGLYNTQKNKPRIAFFDGIKKVQEIFLQTLSAQEIFGIGSTVEFAAISPVFFINYQEQIKTRNIVFHDLLTNASQVSAGKIQEILRGLYDLTVLPRKYADVPTNILIWDNNIALIDFSNPVFGTVLSNTSLAKTFRILFEIMKDTARNL